MFVAHLLMSITVPWIAPGQGGHGSTIVVHLLSLFTAFQNSFVLAQ